MAPLAGAFHSSVRRPGCADATTPVGTAGIVHVPGCATMTASFDATPVPAAFTATTLT